MSLDGLTAVTLDGETVDLPASDIQITVTDVPSEDYAMTCLLSDGEEAVQALLPQDGGNYRITVAVVSANETYAGVIQRELRLGSLPFSDVDADSAAGAAVRFVYEHRLMDGTGNGLFSPEGTVTRTQAITVLARLAGAEPKIQDVFSDVPADAWYGGYVGWAAETGVVQGDGQGDGQGRFLPDSPVTGVQMADMIRRYTGQEAAGSGTDEPLTRAALAAILMELAEGE